MNYLDLFSGIGGFPLGAYWAGMRFDEHYFSEVDEYAIKVYRQRFPGAIPLGDITKIDTARLMADSASQGLERQKPTRGNGREQGLSTECDWLITGGFPCTDISIAGKGAGIRGSRSGLWFEMWRIIRDLRPRFAIIENVGAITHRGLDTVLANLAEIGMDAEWQDIRASDVDAPHRRERIWIVAYPGKQGAGNLNGSLTDERWPTSENRRESIRQENRALGSSGIAPTGQDVADSKRVYVQGCNDRQGQGEPGRDSWWSTEPDVGRVVARLSSRMDGGLNGKAKSNGTIEILQTLQDKIGEAVIQWPVRGLGSIQETEVLLATLCKYKGSPRTLGNVSLESKEVPRIIMRGVWFDGQSACPSCRRESEEQRSRKHPDTVYLLSRLLACDCSSTWLDPTGTPSESSRIHRLKCLGNAIVPQIAEILFRRIKELCDDSKPKV